MKKEIYCTAMALLASACFGALEVQTIGGDDINGFTRVVTGVTYSLDTGAVERIVKEWDETNATPRVDKKLAGKQDALPYPTNAIPLEAINGEITKLWSADKEKFIDGDGRVHEVSIINDQWSISTASGAPIFPSGIDGTIYDPVYDSGRWMVVAIHNENPELGGSMAVCHWKCEGDIGDTDLVLKVDGTAGDWRGTTEELHAHLGKVVTNVVDKIVYESAASKVKSVNGQTGDVNLTAADVGAMPVNNSDGDLNFGILFGEGISLGGTNYYDTYTGMVRLKYGRGSYIGGGLDVQGRLSIKDSDDIFGPGELLVNGTNVMDAIQNKVSYDPTASEPLSTAEKILECSTKVLTKTDLNDLVENKPMPQSIVGRLTDEGVTISVSEGRLILEDSNRIIWECSPDEIISCYTNRMYRLATYGFGSNTITFTNLTGVSELTIQAPKEVDGKANDFVVYASVPENEECGLSLEGFGRVFAKDATAMNALSPGLTVLYFTQFMAGGYYTMSRQMFKADVTQ